jgi:hypothetical protein
LFVLGRGEGLSLFDVYCEYHRVPQLTTDYHTGRTGRGVVWGVLDRDGIVGVLVWW